MAHFGRAWAASGLLLAAVLVFAGPATKPAPAQTPFRFVGVGVVEADGIRFAVLWRRGEPLRAFDTVRGVSFRLEPPSPDCHPYSFGREVVLWNCVGPAADGSYACSRGRPLITELASRFTREPRGFAEFLQAVRRAGEVCEGVGRIGRDWLEVRLSNASNPGSCCDSVAFVNHRTGAVQYSPDRGGFLDLDYPGLIRPFCSPLDTVAATAAISDYAPPFAVRVGYAEPLRVWRCGRPRARRISSCAYECFSSQLGSGLLTWSEERKLLAYVPRTGRRLPLPSVPAPPRHLEYLWVQHTCNRIFAQWQGIDGEPTRPGRVYRTHLRPRHRAARCPTS